VEHKILLIEDERPIAENIEFCLKESGFLVQWASNCHEGMRAFQKESPSLIILDVGLPDGNGYSLCKDIRKTSQVPILFLTARADEIDRIVGLELGADDYMAKPFSPRELCLRVQALLKRQQSPGQNLKTFQVDEDKGRITYRGKILDLSRYEYRILLVLIKRPGMIFSREKLMSMVWESPESSFERTIDTHIKSLRAKLKQADSNEQGIETPIETHRGLGYSLKENL
jgi:two-component system, OmpR family, catabolic regulation response regulator CreB